LYSIVYSRVVRDLACFIALCQISDIRYQISVYRYVRPGVLGVRSGKSSM
jgi:hypothetical protein